MWTQLLTSRNPHSICITLALAVVLFSLFLMLVSADFRQDSPLGTLHEVSGFIVIIPYIVGAIFGSNHRPNDLAFFITLFVQFYFIALLLRLLLMKLFGPNKSQERTE